MTYRNYTPKQGEQCQILLCLTDDPPLIATIDFISETHCIYTIGSGMYKGQYHTTTKNVIFSKIETLEEKMVKDMCDIVPSYTCHSCEDVVNSKADHIVLAKYLVEQGWIKRED